MTLRVNNQLTISSVNGGITLNSENTDFAVNAPHITIKNVGALSGIHLDGAGSTVKVQNFKTFTIDATGKDQWDLYQGNGLRVHQGKSINLIGQAGTQLKLTQLNLDWLLLMMEISHFPPTILRFPLGDVGLLIPKNLIKARV